MPSRRRQRPGSASLFPAQSGRGSSNAPVEWVGGCITLPFYLTESEPAFRPEMLVWLELPDDFVIGHRLLGRGERGSLGALLLEAMREPLVGPPRRPARIRVATEEMAADVRAALAGPAWVTVAPTPEIDALVASMAEHASGSEEPPSYLEDGRVSSATVGALFEAAARLFRAAPWRVATEEQVLEIDIPALGVAGACVSVLGGLGETFGLAIFASREDFEAFQSGAERAMRAPHAAGRVDLGVDELVLLFERKEALPVEMRREIRAHGWPVAGTRAYPTVRRIDRNAIPCPLQDRDVQVAAACAGAIAAFVRDHGKELASAVRGPILESYGEREGGVRVALRPDPGAVEDSAQDEAALPAGMRAGRNDPCPCGSGKKYKKCHLDADRQRASDAAPRRAHGVDEHALFMDLCRYAARRFPIESERATGRFADLEQTLTLAAPWTIYGRHVEGRSIAEWYAAERSRELAPAERTWIERQCAAWLSIWEVIDVEPDVGLTLRDLLTGEERRVREQLGSRNLSPRTAILARVVEHADAAVIDGVHPRGLPPRAAAEVVQAMQRRLRRKSRVPIERLHDAGVGNALIARWEEAVYVLDVRSATPPLLQNTDGDPILITVDHFSFAADARSRIAAALDAIEGVLPPDGEDPGSTYTFLASASAASAPQSKLAVIGTAQLSTDTLRVETNSIRRADALRRRLEWSCGSELQHVAREHSDPLSSALREQAPDAEPPPEALPPEIAAVLLEHKRRHYAEWLDQPLIDLGGKTPREAVRSASGRARVDVILKEIEQLEADAQPGTGMDVAPLRRELGL
jgi:hypothetical protein